MLTDRYGRQITYLRISVTDRCNLRCVYCLPPEGATWQPHDTILRYEEIAEVVRVMAQQGVREVRLTGGEPLVRQDLPRLVRMIADTPGIEDISLTSNGILLERMAVPLAEAGLKRVNISLDTLQAERFARVTRGGSFEKAWKGILAAEAAGLGPIKINAVAMRGVNEDEIIPLARLALEYPWHIRFIELMPVKNQSPWGPGFPDPETVYLPVQEMLEMLAPLGLTPVEASVGSGPAKEYRVNGGPGTVGFITPLGEQFCDRCNRLRLTADGHLRPCLLSDEEIHLLPALRAGQSLLPLIQQAVAAKPLGHELPHNHYPTGRCMQGIGG
jgi:cyclic pyranopterin phosphate synthase